MVLTGGTIGSEPDGGGVLSVSGAPPSAEEIGLLAAAAEPGEELEVEVRSPLRLLSENIEPGDWAAIAATVRELAAIGGLAGVIVLHGTDTMAFSAAALSYLLADLEMTVVLTGSNSPAEQPGSDATRNARVALIALGALPPGVFVAFAGGSDLPGLVHLGTRVRKLRASGQAFVSVNADPVGRVEAGSFVPLATVAPPSPSVQAFRCRVDSRVLSLRLYPGLDFEVAFAAVTAGDVRGVVVELYASATGPDTGGRRSLTRFIRRCAERGVPVLTTVGAAAPGAANRYETAIAIAEAGGLFLAGMLPETATVKLMWALAQHDDPDDVKRLMRTPIAGDMPRSG